MMMNKLIPVNKVLNQEVFFIPTSNTPVNIRIISTDNKSGYSARPVTCIFPMFERVKFWILSSKIESKYALHARATDDVPMTYSKSKFHPITKAHNSPIVT